MRPVYDLMIPRDWVADGVFAGQPGAWRVAQDAIFILPDDSWSGWSGVAWDIIGLELWVDNGFAWNGSNVVRDKRWCQPASMVHDMLCDAIPESDYNCWQKWRLRRRSDRLYSRICDMQGASRLRAKIRFLGLRIRSLWPF